MLEYYEDLNLDTYVDHNDAKKIIASKDAKDENDKTIKDTIKATVDSLKNPYFNLYHWCKGEIYDIDALSNALASLELTKKRIAENERKKRST